MASKIWISFVVQGDKPSKAWAATWWEPIWSSLHMEFWVLWYLMKMLGIQCVGNLVSSLQIQWDSFLFQHSNISDCHRWFFICLGFSRYFVQNEVIPTFSANVINQEYGVKDLVFQLVAYLNVSEHVADRPSQICAGNAAGWWMNGALL